MSYLLLGLTLILYGVQLYIPFLPTVIFAILFIVTGLLILFENKHVVGGNILK